MDRARYEAAPTMDAYVAAAVKHAEFWTSAWRLSVADAALLPRFRAVPGRWNLLALSEDWCGDAINILPSIARLASEVESLRFRVLARDANLDLMDAHQTRGTRSIPVVIVYDEAFREVGWWGPRPAELQAWFYDEGKAMEKAERYKRLRTWYARDRGRTAAREVLEVVERAAAVPPPSTGGGVSR
jgi:hypothetical protein